jgi:NADH-quinone oxidoreductase subunit L
VGWSWGPRFELELAAAGFARVMVVLVPAIAAPVIGYALTTEREGRSRLLALLVAFVGAMELLVLAADFLTLLVGWELVGALSWALIGHGWRDADNPRQGTHAFVTTRAGGLGLYVGAGALFASTGDLAFTSLGRTAGPWLQVVAVGVLVAAAAKSAQVPFAPWLFSAMAGPTPVSALLHSATMVAAGAYLLIRLGPMLEAVDWFAPAAVACGLVTALAGGLVAMTQTHAKRLLAGSTSAQYGLMFVAVGAGSTAAAGVHLVAHAGFKALLFLGAGVAMHASGSGRLETMRLGRALPVIGALSAVGALALAAVPPLGGAWSKEEVVAAAAHASPWLGAGAFVAGLLSAFYALRFQLLAYGPAPPRARLRHEPETGETLALAVLASFSVVLGVLWLPRADSVVEGLTGGELVGAAGFELVISLTLVAAASVVALSLWRSDALLSLGLPASVSRAVARWLGLPSVARAVVDGVLALSRLLARFDDRVIDAGVRGAAALAALVSRLLALRAELSVDSVVRAVTGATVMAARGSRATDERTVDGAVEGLAKGIAAAGRDTRRLQTGLSHQYYVLVAAGLAMLVGVLAVAR